MQRYTEIERERDIYISYIETYRDIQRGRERERERERERDIQRKRERGGDIEREREM